jgi:hypothetical protein
MNRELQNAYRDFYRSLTAEQRHELRVESEGRRESVKAINFTDLSEEQSAELASNAVKEIY